MHSRTSLALAIAIMALSAWGTFSALEWPWKAKLFPLVIGIPLFCLALAEALWVIFGKHDGAAAAISVAADPRPDPPAAGRRERQYRARHRAAARRRARPAADRGEPPRRERQPGDGDRRQGAARWLHAAPRRRRTDRRQPAFLLAAVVRHDERPGAGREPGEHADGARRESRAAGQEPAGIHRLRASRETAARVRLDRQRQPASPGDGDAQTARANRSPARSVQGRRPGDDP